MDARSVNGANESARPLRSRFDQALGQRQRNPQPLRPRLERHVPGSEEMPGFYSMDTPSPPPWRRDDEAPGRQQDVLRPTSAARPREQRRSAQQVMDTIAASQRRSRCACPGWLATGTDLLRALQTQHPAAPRTLCDPPARPRQAPLCPRAPTASIPRSPCQHPCPNGATRGAWSPLPRDSRSTTVGTQPSRTSTG